MTVTTAPSPRRRRGGLRRRLRFAALRVVLFPLVALPSSPARALGSLLGTATWLLAPRLRRRAERNLRLSYPGADAAWISRVGRGVFRWVGQAGADFLHLGRISPEALSRIEVQGRPHLDAALSRGRGVVMVTGHLGNWELLGAWVAALGIPTHVLYHPFREERLDRFVGRLRERAGVRGIPAEGPPLRALRALRRGGILGILVDRVPRGESVPCTFLGRECRAATGAARLALATGATILPVRLVYGRRGMLLFFEPGIDPAREPDGGKGGGGTPGPAVVQITRRVTAVLEGWIRETPEQWPWFDDRWKTRRAEAAPVAGLAGGAAAPGPGLLEEGGAAAHSGS